MADAAWHPCAAIALQFCEALDYNRANRERETQARLALTSSLSLRKRQAQVINARKYNATLDVDFAVLAAAAGGQQDYFRARVGADTGQDPWFRHCGAAAGTAPAIHPVT